MARIARSTAPLYQTRGRPIAWRIRMTGPTGSPLDLTGASAVVTIKARGITDQGLEVGAIGADGIITVTGSPAQSTAMPNGNLSELWLSLTDSQGMSTDYVWPVIGEEP